MPAAATTAESPSSTAAASALREDGNEAFRAGDYLKAAAAYTRALKADPGCAALYSNRALALLKLNKLPKAAADAERCARLEPSNAKGWYRWALALEAQGKVEPALAVVRDGCEAVGEGADRELLSSLGKALGRRLRDQGRAAAAAAAAGPAGATGGVSENGGKAPASCAEAAALAFADAWIAHARERMRESGGDFAPTLHFLPGDGDNTPADPAPGASVQAGPAFADPATLAEFVGFARGKGKELRARAAVAVVPKAKVAFPQTWLKPLWPYAKEQDGVFVQLQALDAGNGGGDDGGSSGGGGGKSAGGKGKGGARKAQREAAAAASNAPDTKQASDAAPRRIDRLWFVRLNASGSGSGSGGGSRPYEARAPQELPHDELAPLPALLG